MLEGELFKKAQESDLESIEEICSSTWEPLYRFIYYKVQNRQEAEDITQETYVKALSHMKKNSFKVDHYVSYLKAISLNILQDKWRKVKRRGISINFEALNPEETAVGDSTEAIATRASIENALNSLSEEQRTVVELRLIKGCSSAETAKIMNKKEGNIRVLQYRALHTLASILNND